MHSRLIQKGSSRNFSSNWDKSEGDRSDACCPRPKKGMNLKVTPKRLNLTLLLTVVLHFLQKNFGCLLLWQVHAAFRVFGDFIGAKKVFLCLADAPTTCVQFAALKKKCLFFAIFPALQPKPYELSMYQKSIMQPVENVNIREMPIGTLWTSTKQG